VVNHINSLRPGGTLYLEDLRQRLRNVDGLFYTGQEILLPLGDVVSKPLQLIRTTLGIVTALSTQNDRPIVTGDNPDSYTLAAG
jgi:hypothetical protein